MARKEDKQPQYLPLIVKAKLHTGGRDYEKIKEELKGQQIPAQILLGGIKMAKKKRKYYSGKELLYRRQLERQQAEAEEKTNNIRMRQLHQINASSRAIGWAKQKMREGKNNDCISD